MVITSPKIIHLSMDFLPPPLGSVTCQEGFLVHIPRALDKSEPSIRKPPQTLRCFLSETTSHSMITQKASKKLSKTFMWMYRGVEIDTVYTPKAEQEYFFTSALGDAFEEDRCKKCPVTPQLVAHGTVDLYFMVLNEEADPSKEPEDPRNYHYFHMKEVVLVTEFFSVGSKPSIITPAEKERMDEKEREMEEGVGAMKEEQQKEEEEDTDSEGFELCLGQDFFQTYPHLMFDITPTPAAEHRISSAHFRRSTVLLTYEGLALSIRAVGVCNDTDLKEPGEISLNYGFAVHFAPESVYNAFYRLPELRERRKAEQTRGISLRPQTTVRACLASLVLALELVISLSRLRLPRRFRGVVLYHNTEHFHGEVRDLTFYDENGLPHPNMDLINRLYLLRDMIQDPAKCDLGQVKFVSGGGGELEPAMMLATLGARMTPFKGLGAFGESRMASGTEHPLDIRACGGIDPNAPEGPSEYYVSVPKEDPSHASPPPPEAPQSPKASTSGPMSEKRGDGCFGIPAGTVVKRSPMFLNFGNTKTYVVKGKPIAYTERQLFMAAKEEIAFAMGHG